MYSNNNNNKRKQSYSRPYNTKPSRTLVYFNLCKTKQEVKLTFRQLAKAYHPDIIGKTEENENRMKDINSEYEYIKNILPNEDPQETEEPEQTEDEYKIHISQEIQAILDEISHLPLDIEIIGVYIWVSGNTYPYRNILSAYNFIWCSKKLMFSWSDKRSNSRKPQDIDKIRFNYGSTKVTNVNRQTIK